MQEQFESFEGHDILKIISKFPAPSLVQIIQSKIDTLHIEQNELGGFDTLMSLLASLAVDPKVVFEF